MRAVAILGAYALLVLLPLLSAALADPIAAQRPWNVELASAAGLLALGVVALELRSSRGCARSTSRSAAMH